MEQKERVRLLRPLCPRCEAEGRVEAGVEFDHRIALVNGGTNEDDNMDLLCSPHHREKTNEDMGFLPRGCDAKGNPIDPRHPWAATTHSVSVRGGAAKKSRTHTTGNRPPPQSFARGKIPKL